MTTIADNFNRSDASSLGTASGGFSWTAVSGNNLAISSNRAATSSNSGAAKRHRAESDLSSSAHYVQISVTALPNVSAQNVALLTRHSPSADSSIIFLVRVDTSNYRLFVNTAGSLVQIGSTVNESIPSTPFTARLESSSGNVHTGYINGVSKVSASDSTFSSNTRTGFALNWISGSAVSVDDFEAGDLGGSANAWYYRAQEEIAA